MLAYSTLTQHSLVVPNAFWIVMHSLVRIEFIGDCCKGMDPSHFMITIAWKEAPSFAP